MSDYYLQQNLDQRLAREQGKKGEALAKVSYKLQEANAVVSKQLVMIDMLKLQIDEMQDRERVSKMWRRAGGEAVSAIGKYTHSHNDIIYIVNIIIRLGSIERCVEEKLNEQSMIGKECMKDRLNAKHNTD